MRLQKLSLVTLAAVVALSSCKKDVDPVIIVPPSAGSIVEFNGLLGAEAGSSAGNSVYLDLSSNTMTTLARSSWDLGFYSGAEFRVILNNTSSAGAKVLAKTDLASVGSADTVGLTLSVNQLAPAPAQLAYFDDVAGSITGTVIPEVSSTESNSKVVIINRGTGGGIAARPWYKVKVIRNGTGYTLQYAELNATTFQTLNVAKESDYHFKLVSFDNGLLANGQPQKNKWDIVWSYSVFQTDFGGGAVPYNFSDLIATNNLSNVQVKQVVYKKTATQDSTIVAAAAYVAFNKDSVAKYTLENNRWAIGSNWRSTQPATGARLDRFYIIKDADGNYYKLKTLSMGVGADGGTRGKPKFEYALIP